MYQYLLDILARHTKGQSTLTVRYPTNKTLEYYEIFGGDDIFIGSRGPNSPEIYVLLLLDKPVVGKSVVTRIVNRYRGGILIRMVEKERIGMFTDEMPAISEVLPNFLSAEILMAAHRITYDRTHQDIRISEVKSQTYPFSIISYSMRTASNLSGDEKTSATIRMIKETNDAILNKIIAAIRDLHKFYNENYQI